MIYLNADCMNPETGLPSYSDNHFDLAIVDPPYGIGADTMTGGAAGAKLKRTSVNWDNCPPTTKYFDELFRVSKNQIVWGGNYFGLPPTKCVLAWDKKNDARDFAEFELAWTSFDTVARFFRMRPMGMDGGKWHPCQKPERMYKWLLKNYAKEGDLILDTHVGSASSLIAFEEMGFDYVGFELDADYYRDSCKRIEAFRAQPKLFTGKEVFEASKPPTLFE